MPDSRQSLIGLLKEMRIPLIVAGVDPNQINIRILKPHIKTLAAAFDWLHNLKLSFVYQNVCRIYNLLPPETWVSYETLEIEGLAEQILLTAASKKLLTAWRKNRPRLFGTSKKSKK